MKVIALVDYHDTTIGKVYETGDEPSWAGYTGVDSIWVKDDVGDDYILFPYEYEVIKDE